MFPYHISRLKFEINVRFLGQCLPHLEYLQMLAIIVIKMARLGMKTGLSYRLKDLFEFYILNNSGQVVADWNF